MILMKKVLSTSTKLVQAGLAVKGFVDTALHPLQFARNVLKKIIVQSIVFIIKKAINFTVKGKVNGDSHIVIRQLNALTDSDVDMTGLRKDIQFKMTLDSLLKEANEVVDYKVLKYINLTKFKNKVSLYKNEIRDDIYAYIIENNFENMTILVNSVNEILNIPTQVVGCEFAQCAIEVENHNEINKDFSLLINVSFAVKSVK